MSASSTKSLLPLRRNVMTLCGLILVTSLSACGGGGGSSSSVDNNSGGSESTDYETAFRFLRQASFGPNEPSITAVMEGGINNWLEQQFVMQSAYDNSGDNQRSHLQRLIQVAQAVEPGADWFPDNASNDSGSAIFNGRASSRTDIYQMSVWFENALEAPDQLRQRVAYALSQILVTSSGDPQLDTNAEALAHYYDILARNALGNFRTLLDEVARSPAMGIYLSHQGNEKASDDGKTLPDENFARELMQLFAIGLYQVNLDGSPKTNGNGELIPTYTQQDIEEMSKVMTGWDLRYNSRYGRTNGSYVHYMEFDPEHHQTGSKQVMGSTIFDDGAGGDLSAALDLLFNHSNAGPFIGKQLIQRLVSSNPSPAYIARVASAFNDNGAGERGDLAAVVRAVLLDEEARSTTAASSDNFGKTNEHLLVYTSLLRAFNVQPLDGWQLNADNGKVPVNGIYYFNNIRSLLGQGALRAPSVFNFYDPDYVPQDAFYRDVEPQRVLPELQLRSPNNITNMFEASRVGSNLLERNEVLRSYDSVNAYVADRNNKGSGDNGNWNGSRALALLDYTPILQAFEQAMEGDNNGDYSLINDTSEDDNGNTPKQRGLHALLGAVEVKLLGAALLSQDFRDQLITHLDTDSYFNTNSSTADREAIRVAAGAIQYVMLSSANMAQQ
ncbi:MAG: DUF1800 domain-containing protein [Spongiibacteraceae bacterium]